MPPDANLDVEKEAVHTEISLTEALSKIISKACIFMKIVTWTMRSKDVGNNGDTNVALKTEDEAALVEHNKAYRPMLNLNHLVSSTKRGIAKICE